MVVVGGGDLIKFINQLAKPFGANYTTAFIFVKIFEELRNCITIKKKSKILLLLKIFLSKIEKLPDL